MCVRGLWYCQAVGVVPEGQWDAFRAALDRRLPVCFRINPNHPSRPRMVERMRHLQRGGEPVTIEGTTLPPPW